MLQTFLNFRVVVRFPAHSATLTDYSVSRASTAHCPSL
eukprot:PDM70082.1 hypothetical protein PRIPAC_49294 [Pristionchus pacificus]